MYLLPMKIGLILRLTWWSLFYRVKHSRFVKMSFRTNSQFLGASVNEFIQVWALGGDASLNLYTRSGLTTVAFDCTIGQPGAPHSHAPFSAPLPSHTSPPPPHRPRHRWKGKKQTASCPPPGCSSVFTRTTYCSCEIFYIYWFSDSFCLCCTSDSLFYYWFSDISSWNSFKKHYCRHWSSGGCRKSITFNQYCF